MAKTIELLLEQSYAKPQKSKALFYLHGCIKPWYTPMQNSIPGLLLGYQSGLEFGDIVAAGMNLASRGHFLWFSGRPLEGVELEQLASHSIYAELKQKVVLSGLVACKKMRGSHGLSTKLIINDEEIDFDDLKTIQLANKLGGMSSHACVVTTELEVLVIYQDFDTARSILMNTGDLRPHLRGLFQDTRYTFLVALICIKSAQKESSWLARRRLKSRGLKATKIIRKWVSLGNVNLVHLLHLLEAELAVLNGDQNATEDSFKAAQSTASRHGFLQYKALSHELASLYYASKGDTYWEEYNLDRAIEAYSDWQATAKVAELEKKKQMLLKTKSTARSSANNS